AQSDTTDIIHPDVANADPGMPHDGEESQRGQRLPEGETKTGEGEQVAPAIEVDFGREQEADQQHDGVHGHDDGGDALHDEIDRAVVRAHNQTLGTNTFLSRHYHTPNSLRPKTTVRARLTP